MLGPPRSRAGTSKGHSEGLRWGTAAAPDSATAVIFKMQKEQRPETKRCGYPPPLNQLRAKTSVGLEHGFFMASSPSNRDLFCSRNTGTQAVPLQGKGMQYTCFRWGEKNRNLTQISAPCCIWQLSPFARSLVWSCCLQQQWGMVWGARGVLEVTLESL